MMQRLTVLALLLGIVWAPAASGAQESPTIPEDLQETYGAFAAAMVEGDEGVVTLAGRYTNPSGAAGVYSNTWERRPDGSWKLAASVQ